MKKLLVIICISAAWNIQAQVVATAQPDSNRILIGDHLNVRLDASVPLGYTLQWPQLPEAWGKLEVIHSTPIDTMATAAEAMYSQQLTVTAYDSGLVMIPALQFVARDPNNRSAQVRTQRVPIAVSTMAVVDTLPMAPIKEILIVESSWRDHIWLLLGALILLAMLIMFAVIFIKRNKKNAAQKLPEEDPLPRKIAENIQANRTDNPARLEAQYAELAYALKLWLFDRYEVKALDKPTAQVKAALQAAQMPDDTKSWAVDVMQECDKIKFAQAATKQDRVQHIAQELLNCIQAEKRIYVSPDE